VSSHSSFYFMISFFKGLEVSQVSFFCSMLLFLIGLCGGTLLPVPYSIEPVSHRLPASEIFSINILTATKILLGGLTFGVLTGWYLFTAGMFIGVSFKSLMLKNNFLGFMLGVMPHGMFEFTGIILAGAAGFETAYFFKKRITENTGLKEDKTCTKRALFYLLMITLLIGIGSLIESKITPDLVEWGIENGII